MRTQNFSSTLFSMLLAGTVGVACQSVKETAQSTEEAVKEKAEDARATLDAREDTVNIEPSSGAPNGRRPGEAEDMRIEPDMDLTDPTAPVTTEVLPEVAEDDAALAASETDGTGVIDETDDTSVAPAPIVTADSGTNCNRPVLAMSPGAVGNPCMTTVAFVDTLNLDAEGRADALDGVAKARGDVDASTTSH